MKVFFKTTILLTVLVLVSTALPAQVQEHTFTWFAGDHSAWKIQPNNPTGYVIMGNKFFEPNNTNLYITGFDEFGQHQWTRTHATGLTQVQTMWKSFTLHSSPVRYFAALQGTQGGQNVAYAILMNAYGMKLWDRVSPLPMGIQFGGVTPATNGGYIAVGSTNEGQIAAVKFDAYGVLQWAYSYPVSGFAWSVTTAPGGGYVMAGTRAIVKIDHLGNFVTSGTLSLPNSPAPDGSAYTYTEFEEIINMPNGEGYILTGSAFSNQTSAAYTARLNYNLGTTWSKIHDPQNTALAGTPVAWINNAFIQNNNEIVTSWRRGPVSTGGTIFFQRMNFAGGLNGGVASMGNTIPLQEGFMTKAHGKIVVGGTRGGYSSAYVLTREFLPASLVGDADDRTESEPLAEEGHPLTRIRTTVYNARPEFVPVEPHPASRVYQNELHVYPNPVSGWLNIDGALEPGAQLSVMNTTGQVVAQQKVQAGDVLAQFDLTGLAPGLYIVEMRGANGRTTKKVIVE